MAYSTKAVIVVAAALLLTATGSYQLARHHARTAIKHDERGTPRGRMVEGRTTERHTASRRSKSVAPVALPPPGTPVAELIPMLTSHAERGSARAACRLAVELKRCEAVDRVADLALLVSGNSTPTAHQDAARMLDQTERAAAACKGVAPEQIARAFDYQTIAFDGGDPRLQRWFVRAPALEFSEFVNRLDDWQRYRERVMRYRGLALERMERDDLQELVYMHTPPAHMTAPMTVRVHDDALFVALFEAAELNGIELAPFAAAAVASARAELSDAQRTRYLRLRARFVRRWTPGAKPKQPSTASDYFGSIGPEACDVR